MTIRRMLAVGALLGVLGALVVVSGVVSIKASSGHFAITDWFLHFAMRRSVKTHALGVELPPLDDDRLVLEGAGHYETGCRWCHGIPDDPLPRVPQAMTPPPPALPPKVVEWTPEQLFYIVKHGVKFTGMPAWPTQRRDDEVHAMVAFLLELPKIDADAYRRLVFGDATAAPAPDAPAAAIACARCHGRDGNGRDGAFPRLAGQRERYLRNALRAYARGERHSGVMQPIAAALRPPERRQLAAYYALLPPRAVDAAAPADAEAIARGRRIATGGVPARRVPACAECHGPGVEPRNHAYPRLAGQPARYLRLNLELFKTGNRGGSGYAHLMQEVAPKLSDAEIRDVAAYYASLPPTP